MTDKVTIRLVGQSQRDHACAIIQNKAPFLNALDKEMQFLPELEGGGMFVVGQRSSLLSKERFRDLIEIMFAYGSKYDVIWSAKATENLDEIRNIKK